VTVSEITLSRPPGFLRDLWRHRDLVRSMIYRQYQLRYRQSFAGFAWAIVPPLATLATATLVFHKVARIDTGNVPYAMFALSALAPWTFFSSSLTQGIPSIVGSQQMVSRLSFPRAVLPMGYVGASFIDLGAAGLVFVVYAYATRAGLPLTAAWAPVLLILEAAFTVGTVLLGAALNCFARDIRLAVPLVSQIWLFITPVMYPLKSVPRSLRFIYLLNPMTGIIEAFRSILVYGHAPDPKLLTDAIIGSVVVLLVGSWYFRSTERRFADVI